jgi:hypothetical protein
MTRQVFKKLNACSLFLFLLTISSSAQFSVPTKISTPYGSRTIWTPGYTKWHQNYGNQKGGIVSNPYNFTIVLLNDSSFEVKGKINLDSSVSSLKWGKKENAGIIKPFETKEIYRMAGEKKIRGVPGADSCWLFLADSGKINTYSVTSELDYPTIAYIQNGNDGEIVPLNAGRLIDIVGIDDESILSLIRKEKLTKAIKKYNNK